MLSVDPYQHIGIVEVGDLTFQLYPQKWETNTCTVVLSAALQQVAAFNALS
jgi:hypothetical protein